MHTCEQTATIDAIHETLKRVDRTQERLLDVLERVADQGARIEFLEEEREVRRRDTDELYNRLRRIDLKIDRFSRFLSMIENKYFLGFLFSILGITMTGAILDCIYHTDTVKAFIKFFKG